MITDDRWQRTGWPEILIGFVAYAVLLVSFGLLMGLLPSNDPVILGVVGSTAGGFVGIGAFAAAYGLRIRALRPFGFRPVSPRWLMIATGVGLIGYGLNLIIQFTYQTWFGSSDPQSILHAAARGGPLPFLLSFLGGAIFTPFGEEILFRGVIANALNRYGAFAGRRTQLNYIRSRARRQRDPARRDHGRSSIRHALPGDGIGLAQRRPSLRL